MTEMLHRRNLKILRNPYTVEISQKSDIFPIFQEEQEEQQQEPQQEASEQTAIDNEMSMVCKTSWESKGRQAVRDVYNRACLVHCQKKAMIRLRWAAFEEDSGDCDKAKEILTRLRDTYPLLLECRIQIIDIERRLGNLERSEEEYKVLINKVPKNRNSIRTWLAIKLARFQFKVKGQADKALATLRGALKKEKGKERRKNKWQP